MIYERSAGAWTVAQELPSPVPGDASRSGHDVAIDGDTLVVSDRSEDLGDQTAVGAVYVYRRGADSRHD